MATIIPRVQHPSEHLPPLKLHDANGFTRANSDFFFYCGWLHTLSHCVSSKSWRGRSGVHTVSNAWENPAACKSMWRLNLSDMLNMGFKDSSEPRRLLPDQVDFTWRASSTYDIYPRRPVSTSALDFLFTSDWNMFNCYRNPMSPD